MPSVVVCLIDNRFDYRIKIADFIRVSFTAQLVDVM